MAKAGARNGITLACTECKQRNYQTNKNKKNDPDRIELNKYCKFCKKHTLHKETKQFLHKVMQGYSSIGRVAVSKTVGCGFKSYCPCQMFIVVVVCYGDVRAWLVKKQQFKLVLHALKSFFVK